MILIHVLASPGISGSYVHVARMHGDACQLCMGPHLRRLQLNQCACGDIHHLGPMHQARVQPCARFIPCAWVCMAGDQIGAHAAHAHALVRTFRRDELSQVLKSHLSPFLEADTHLG